MFRSVPVAIAVVLSLSTAYGGPVSPSKPSQIVTLFQSGPLCPTEGFAIADLAMSDGTIAPFVIPPKEVLVVTGFEWLARGGTAGSGVRANLTTQASGTPTLIYATSTTTFDSDGNASKNEVTPLIVIKPGRTICIFIASGTAIAGFVHGFLAPDK
jgi:hypothetical protein